MSAEPSVVVTTLVEVDPATAFTIFTEDVDAWWKEGPRYRVYPDRPSTMRFEPGVGGRLVEASDDTAAEDFEHGKVRVWDPPKRLVFEMSGRDFGPGESVEVEVLFELEGAATRVTVENRGWGRFPPEHPIRHGLDDTAYGDMMRTWWLDLLLELGNRSRRAGNQDT
jgi:uncharacterized protein YndB with AHSA1/START domain